jgi:hypothetical protein
MRVSRFAKNGCIFRVRKHEEIAVDFLQAGLGMLRGGGEIAGAVHGILWSAFALENSWNFFCKETAESFVALSGLV